MPKITYKELDQYFSELQKSRKTTVLEMEKLSDNKLSTAVYEFARLSEDKELYNMVLKENVSVIVDGEVKHPDLWPYLRVNELTEVVITPMLKGGGGGKWIGIALGVVMIVVGVLLAPWTGGTSTYMAQIGWGLIISGAGMILSSLAGMLFAPDLPQDAASEDQNRTKTYSWSGIRSIARAGVPVPLLIGSHMVGGYIISLYSRAKGGDNYLYALLAISEGEIEGLCQADKIENVCITSDKSNANYKDPAIYLNDQLLRNFADVQWWFRNGYNTEDPAKDAYDCTSQNQIPNFNDVRVQFDDGRDVVPWADNGIVYTTKSAVDAVEVNLTSGALYSMDQTTGTLSGRSINYRLQYKKSTDTSWINHTIIGTQACLMCLYFTASDSGVLACANGYGIASYDGCNSSTPDASRPCYAIGNKYQAKPFVSSMYYTNGSSISKGLNVDSVKRIRIHSTSIGTTTAQGWLGAYPVPGMTMTFQIFENGSTSYYSAVVQQYYVQEQVWSENVVYTPWDSASYTAPGWVIADTLVWPSSFTVDIGSFRLVFVNYLSMVPYTSGGLQSEFIAYSKQVYSGTIWGTISSKGEREQVYQVEKIEFPSNDRWDIKIGREAVKSTSQYIYEELQLGSVVEINYDPLIYPNTALLGIEIRANEQLSGSPPNVTIIAKGLKVSIPEMGSKKFDEIFWDPDQSRWEDADGNLVNWDGTTLVTEYTVNFAAHLRNIMLNERYGTGSYIKQTDLNYSSWVEILKDCHTTWKPALSSHDWSDWWTGTDACSDSDWSSRVQLLSPTVIDPVDLITYDYTIKDVTNRKIYSNIYKGVGYLYYERFHFVFRIVLPDVLPLQTRMLIEITFSNYTSGVDLDVEVSGIDIADSGVKIHIDTARSLTLTDDAISFDIGIPGTINSSVLDFDIYGSGGNQFHGELIDISIKQFSTHSQHFHEANGIAEASQAADSFFNELCHSFRCWLITLGNQLHFKSNKDELPLHSISDTNIIENSFEQNFSSLSTIPYRLEAQFTNAAKRFDMDQRAALVPLVEANRSSSETLGLKYITDTKKVERELVFQANLLANCNHLVSMKIDSEFLHATAGDIINVQHSLPNWGSGQSGRITRFDDGSSLIFIDKAYTFVGVSSYDFSIMYVSSPNTTNTVLINKTGISEGQALNRIVLQSWPANPIVDSAYIIGINEYSVKLFRLLSVRRDKDQLIETNGLIHNPDIYELSTATIIQPTIAIETNSYRITIKGLSVEQVTTSDYSFSFRFNIVCTSQRVDSFVIEMSNYPTSGFAQITTIDGGARSGIYNGISSQFVNGAAYYFRVYGKNSQLRSNYAYASIVFVKPSVSLSPPTGLRLFGQASNSTTWYGKNVTFCWNASTSTNCNYLIEIYKGSGVSSENLLRTDQVSNCQYTYGLSDNIADARGTPQSSVYVRVATITYDGNITSTFTPAILFQNDVPGSISSLIAMSVVGGVQFIWRASSCEDHKVYYLRTKVGSGDWSDWSESYTCEYLRQLTPAEISIHGSGVTIYIEVKDKDWYEQLSVTATSTSQAANEIGDSIFRLVVTASAGTGDLNALHDGTNVRGGWIFGS